MTGRGKHAKGAVALLETSAIDLHGDQQAAGVGNEMALAALDLLARVPGSSSGQATPRAPPLSVVLTPIGCRRCRPEAGLSPLGLTCSHQEVAIDACSQAVITPRGDPAGLSVRHRQGAYGNGRQVHG